MSILLKFSDYDNLTEKRIIYLESKKSNVTKYDRKYFMFYKHTEDENHRYIKIKEIDTTTRKEINDFIYLSRRELRLNYTLRVLI
jgi:hypothetical protein